MSELEYSYSVLKYRHDAAAGEVLNLGVVIYSPTTGQVGVLHDHRYARLSQAFANFDGDLYKSLLDRLRGALEKIGRPLTGGLFEIESRSSVKDVSTIIRQAWPDQGLSYFAGSVAYGVAEDIDRELTELFDRFVLSQSDRRDARARFDDEQLWDEFKKTLSPRGILHYLQPIILGPAEVEFEHAYKNEKWHVFEAVSLDYVDGSGMKRRAYEVAGKASAVRSLGEFGSLTILLGGPRRAESDRQYESAKRILRDASGHPRIVESDDMERLAAEVELEMRSHGAMPDDKDSGPEKRTGRSA